MDLNVHKTHGSLYAPSLFLNLSIYHTFDFFFCWSDLSVNWVLFQCLCITQEPEFKGFFVTRGWSCWIGCLYGSGINSSECL